MAPYGFASDLESGVHKRLQLSGHGPAAFFSDACRLRASGAADLRFGYISENSLNLQSDRPRENPWWNPTAMIARHAGTRAGQVETHKSFTVSCRGEPSTTIGA